MEPNAPFALDYRFLATLLLEIAQERSLDSLLQRVARRALDAPVAPMSLVVVWLIENVETSAGAPQSADAGDRRLYAVAGGTRASDAPPHVSRLPDQLARVRIGDGGPLRRWRRRCWQQRWRCAFRRRARRNVGARATARLPCDGAAAAARGRRGCGGVW
ncbi:MAG: hypothetical protein HMLKMBBP_00085 [Planctomycetes bacterium]|nr:hypothetical protein [Planctomycetota bacterium]